MFAVDDDIESSPKFEAIDELPSARRSRAFEAWVRLGAACRKRGNGGLVTPALLDKVLRVWTVADRVRAMTDLVEARGGRANGLVEVEGSGWRFHEWEIWQPTVEESSVERQARSAGAERSRRWRLRKRCGVPSDTPDDTPERDEEASRATSRDTPDATSRDTSRGDAGDVSRARSAPATRARVPVPPRPIPSPEEIPEKISSAGSPPIRSREPGPLGTVAGFGVSMPGPVERPSLGRLLQGFQRRWEAKRLPGGMALGPGWPGPGKHIAAAEKVAELYADKPDELAASLDGFFASVDPFVVERRWIFGLWIGNPGKYASARVEPEVDMAKLSAGIPRGDTSDDDDGPIEMVAPPRTKRRA